MNVFIVRPFGNRTVLKKNKTTKEVEKEEYNFDTVEKELIRPAMEQLNLTGGTTGEIFESGDIKEDMFSLLLQADIVIADITVHNANVFYELGIRHALRDKKTVLIKCPGYDETPFDISSSRYMTYKKDNPAAALPELINTLKETVNSDRKDSPVFKMLPALTAQDPEKYQAIPAGYIEDIARAVSEKDAGKLLLFRTEINHFAWRTAALRMIGKALLWDFELYDFAAEVMEDVRAVKPDDIQANDWLSTIYQRLASRAADEGKQNALLDKSDRAIGILIQQRSKLSQYKQAEVYALRARNLKSRWANKWRKKNTVNEKQKAALASNFVYDSIKDYKAAFESDLNHYYSGSNALCLIEIVLSLAKQIPETWKVFFDDESDEKLKKYEDDSKKLFVLVNQSIDAEIKKVGQMLDTETDPEQIRKLTERLVWARISKADLSFLKTSVNDDPEITVIKYKKAIESNTQQFNISSAVAQLKIFAELEIRKSIADAVINESGTQKTTSSKPRHILLFTGHMIDKPDRATPRFPAAKEDAVKQAILDKVNGEIINTDAEFIGIAGGACGGDILFHEICIELSIQSHFYLALPPESFKVESVSFAGAKWVDRFNKLEKKLPVRILSKTKELPKWMVKKQNYTIWERNNLWELNNALLNGGSNMTLIALWDGKGGDGPGGTQHMVDTANKSGARVLVIDITTL